MRQCIILTVGVPGCGKTTWANRLLARSKRFVNVNRDDLRRDLACVPRDTRVISSKDLEHKVTSVQLEIICRALDAGSSVIISDTNINPETRERFRRVADLAGVPVFEKHFKESCNWALLSERNKTRPEYDRVPHKVLRDFYIRYREQNFRPARRNAGLPMAYIFDIDGTLATHEGIRSPYEWYKVGLDDIKEDVCRALQAMHYSKFKIVVVSGRDGCCREHTINWLRAKNLPFDELFMREAGSNEKDSIVKYDIFKNHIEGRYNVVGVFDDRDQVVAMWREIGLTCFQVCPGNF